MRTISPLQRGHYYHIYNRGNNRENLFREERNYAFFFNLYIRHIEPIAETYAYCLLRNHFHLLVYIKNNSNVAREPSRSFSNLFNAYARAFNRAYGRTGALFQRPFGRVQAHDERYCTRLVVYIHRNPARHGFVADFRDWPYSSYHTLRSSQATRLRRETVLHWFGGADGFVTAHAGASGFTAPAAIDEDDMLPDE